MTGGDMLMPLLDAMRTTRVQHRTSPLMLALLELGLGTRGIVLVGNPYTRGSVTRC